MKDLFAVTVRFVPATNFKGSRIRLATHDWEGGKTIRRFISFNYAFSSVADAAAAFFAKYGLPPEATAQIKGSNHVILFHLANTSKVVELLRSR